MTRKALIAKFCELLCPGETPLPFTQSWTKGKNALRLRMKAGGDVIFTYLADDDWKVETVKMWEKSKDGI